MQQRRRCPTAILKAFYDGVMYDVKVDEEDAWRAKYKWYLTKDGYPYRNRSYKPQPRKGRPWRVTRRVYLHREILGLKHGHKREGDHKDNDPTNNRRGNLQIVTRKKNIILSYERRPRCPSCGSWNPKKRVICRSCGADIESMIQGKVQVAIT